ncbi:MAG: hypothetical protein HOP12_01355 [Candidatus Eisenbacteria bacterium]|uniref:Thioredoxin domain-containing protein n=1 Tax=Eiseniibacteriota bacterium TaxID=2212470 RepID=A0A849SJR7_UNCEI|nr:hypothetical protein [Candidatus Eisenbacteria bacterium]
MVLRSRGLASLPTRRWITVLTLGALLVAASAHADRIRVYSIQGLDCGDCGNVIRSTLKRVDGVKRTAFDIQKAELTVTLADQVTDEAVLIVIASSGAGFSGTVGAGQGAYLPFGMYPAGADVVVLTENGSVVGPLERLRVAGKYTVFDVYADWCGPCRVVDAELRTLTEQRRDLAIRKLDVVDFKSPLARELGARLKALPYLVVFSPDGKRTDLVGANIRQLASALRSR